MKSQHLIAAILSWWCHLDSRLWAILIKCDEFGCISCASVQGVKFTSLLSVSSLRSNQSQINLISCVSSHLVAVQSSMLRLLGWNLTSGLLGYFSLRSHDPVWTPPVTFRLTANQRSTEASWDLEFCQELLIEESRNTKHHISWSCSSTGARTLFYRLCDPSSSSGTDVLLHDENCSLSVHTVLHCEAAPTPAEEHREQLSLQRSFMNKGISDWLLAPGLFFTCVCWLIGLVCCSRSHKLLDRYWWNFHHRCVLAPTMTD